VDIFGPKNGPMVPHFFQWFRRFQMVSSWWWI
jgi:hypothetical protein